MAGRIRSIKPEILDDEKTAHLSHLEWRLFVSSWLLADDHGSLRADASYVRAAVLWATDDTREEVAEALARLSRNSLLTLYRVRGQVYANVTNWIRHQRVDHPGKPRMPGPDADGAEPLQGVTEIREILARVSREPSRESRESLAPDLRSPITDHRSASSDPRARARDLTASEPGHVAPDADAIARGRLRVKTWNRVLELQRQLAPNLPEQDLESLPGRDLGQRIREAGSIELAEKHCDHAIACIEREARTHGDPKWILGSFTERAWQRLLGMSRPNGTRSSSTVSVDYGRWPTLCAGKPFWFDGDHYTPITDDELAELKAAGKAP